MGNSKRAIVIGLAAAITFGTTIPSSAANATEDFA
jgi:hypothetical protein